MIIVPGYDSSRVRVILGRGFGSRPVDILGPGLRVIMAGGTWPW